jgi:hypothetical protein
MDIKTPSLSRFLSIVKEERQSIDTSNFAIPAPLSLGEDGDTMELTKIHDTPSEPAVTEPQNNEIQNQEGIFQRNMEI